VNVLENSNSTTQPLKFFGEYHVGEEYDISEWLMYPGCCVFKCYEIVSSLDVKSSPLKYLVVSQSYILVFKALKIKTRAKLISATRLFNLLELRKSSENEKVLTLCWKETANEGVSENVFLVEEAKECINLILKNMETFGATVEKKSIVKQTIEELKNSLAAIAQSIEQDKTMKKLEQEASILSEVLALLDD
jgi:hypothetical protein